MMCEIKEYSIFVSPVEQWKRIYVKSNHFIMKEYPPLDLVIVGAQKSFTTSLKAYLGEHPSVFAHPQKEFAYFIDNKEYENGYEEALLHYYRGLEEAKGKKIIAKSAILYMSEEGIKRLYDHNPNCKLLISLRNPVDRAYSSYLMQYNFSDVDFPFEQITSVVENPDTSYWPFRLFIDAGNYAKHLKTIYKYFPKNQVMVILSSEILENPLKICKQIFQWLGVDATYTPEIKIYNSTVKRASKFYTRIANALINKSPIIRKSARLIVPSYYHHRVGEFIREVNKTKKKYGEMDVAIRKYPLEYYCDANKELEEMTGKKVTTLWSK